MKNNIRYLFFLTIFIWSFQIFAKFKNNAFRQFTEITKNNINGVEIEEKSTVTFTPFFDQKDSYKVRDLIGFTFPPDSLVEHEKIIDGQRIYKVHYTISKYGQRYFEKKEHALKHVIIAGDSNIFAEGVDDSFVATELLNKSIPSVQIYNFGHRGGAPHNTLSLLEHFPFEKLIKEQNGIFLYNFFPGHMFERVIGSKNYTCWDLGKAPYYKLNENNEAQYQGSFHSRSIIHPFYKFICQNKLLNSIFKDLPQIGTKDIELVAKVFLKMKNLYLSKFPKSQFYVVINRAYTYIDSDHTIQLIKELKKNNIDIVYMPFIFTNPQNFFPIDLHLNINGQKAEALHFEKLILEIFSLNQKSTKAN